MFKNSKSLLFLNLIVFWLLFSLMRIFLIYFNNFQSYINSSYSVSLILIAGALEDLLLVLIFGVILVLLTLMVKRDNSNIGPFKVFLIFVFALEFWILLATVIDTVYFSLARSHLRYISFGYLSYLHYFLDSILDFFNLANILLLLSVIILFSWPSYFVVKKINNHNLPTIKIRVFILVSFLILFLLLSFINSKIVFDDHLIEDVGHNFFIQFVLAIDRFRCHPPALRRALERMDVNNLEDKYIRLGQSADNYIYFNDNYPLAKSKISDLCLLELITDERCQQDNDHDSYILKDDCDDNNKNIHPQAKEIFNNSVDENCNGIDDAKPNVILVVLESFGAKYLSSEVTPNITELAKNNFSFTNFYSNGTDTSRSFISVFCSVLPKTGLPEINESLNLDLLCLPDILKKFGYYNIEMQAGDLDFLDKRPFLRKIGFDEMLGKNELGGQNQLGWGITDKELFQQVTTKIDQLDQQPFFLTIYSLAVHHPFELPVDGQEVYPPDNFANVIYNLIHYTDAALGEFLTESKDQDWFKNSIIIVTADNSQPVGERIYNYINFVYLFEENIWVPFIMVKNSGEKLVGQSDIIGSHIDIAPTILDLLGIETVNHFQGKSLLQADLKYQDSFMYSTSPYLGCMSAYRQGDYKLIKRFYSNIDLLYNLTEDKKEANNLKAEEPSLFQQFNNMISQIFLYQYYFFKHNKFWSADLQSLSDQLTELKQAN